VPAGLRRAAVVRSAAASFAPVGGLLHAPHIARGSLPRGQRKEMQGGDADRSGLGDGFATLSAPFRSRERRLRLLRRRSCFGRVFGCRSGSRSSAKGTLTWAAKLTRRAPST
jgi:hypothetical protein